MTLSELNKFLPSLEQEFGLETDGILWHYTNSRGIEGIVRNRTIRLSHPGFMNDPSELLYARKKSRHFLSELACDGYPDLDADFRRKYVETMNPTVFVASFCKDWDNLDLWREYGDDGGGFALGFRMKKLRDILAKSDKEDMGIPKLVYCYRVLYDRNEQKKLTSKIWEFWRSKFEETWTDRESSTANLMIHGFFEMLDLFSPFFKHPCYESEKESRLVLHYTSVDSEKTQYLPRRGYFKPYIDLEIKTEENEESPLAAVVAGPATDPFLSERSLRMFLISHGQINVQICRSALPYRGTTS